MLRLSQNFRSRAPILRFVNRVFSELIVSSPVTGQPAYEPIAPPPGVPDVPSVIALRLAEVYDSSTLLAAEAFAITRFVEAVRRGRYDIRDPQDGRMRKARSGDVMVLARRLTHVDDLEDALESAGHRFVTEGGKSFFDRQEVHELLAVLHAVDDPADRTALVAALRSSFFGVSDRDIACHFIAGGRLRIGEVDWRHRVRRPSALPWDCWMTSTLRAAGRAPPPSSSGSTTRRACWRH